jgi:hypothetical protein
MGHPPRFPRRQFRGRSFKGFLLGKHYLIHDRDTKFTQAFDTLHKDSGEEEVHGQTGAVVRRQRLGGLPAELLPLRGGMTQPIMREPQLLQPGGVD